MSSPSGGILTGARAAVGALEDAGVSVAFGLPGVHNLALWRELNGSPIRLVGVRHEQTAAYAADGFARASGRLGVALTTTGPGAANTLAAVGEAWASRQPIVVIATDIPSTARRHGVWRGTLHEATDQAAMFTPVVKEAIRVHSADEIGPAVARAARTAPEAPARPVYVEIPTDLLDAKVESPRLKVSDPLSRGDLDRGQLERALEILERARRPLIWAGGGALQSGAGDAVGRLAERLVAPVILTFSAKGLLPRGHGCLVESSPHVPEAGELWDEADVVVAIGSDLDGMMTQGWKQPQPPHLVAINVDPTDASKNYRPDAVVEADAAAATSALAEQLGERGGLDSLQRRVRELNRGVRKRLVAEEPEASAFLEALEAALPDEAVVVCDMCIPGYWLGGFHRPPAPRKLSYPLGWGTLGCAFPQGLGAALAGTGPAVSISGDGGFLYACGELAAAKQENIPLTAVIVDDGGYGMIRYDQDLHGDPREGVDLVSPDFVALAASFGVRADSVDGLGEHFAMALKGHVALREPTMLVAKAALGPPPNVSPRWYRK
jgi:thiamine pyrophosphate-dependent acetolactate synthase large subunit-like protein